MGRGFFICLKTALTNGADVNYSRQGQYTPLGLAVNNKNINLVSLLLTQGANVNGMIDRWSFYETPLLIAVGNDDLRIAQLLVQAGADVNASRESKKNGFARFESNGDGCTPLILAIEKDIVEQPSILMVKFLLSNGANVNQGNAHGFTPLMAAANPKWGDTQKVRCEITKILLDAGADPSMQDNGGNTALKIAIRKNLRDMINLLLPISPK